MRQRTPLWTGREIILEKRVDKRMTGKPIKANAGLAVDELQGAGLPSRPVLTVAEATRAPGSHVEVCVTLRVGRQRFEGLSAGVGLDVIELRLAAKATLDAIHKAVGTERFHLVGIKRLHAFDADVILVALRDQGECSRRYIGAVTVRSTNVHAAAAAVLDATNRILTAPVR
jgi:hypothetical protein